MSVVQLSEAKQRIADIFNKVLMIIFRKYFMISKLSREVVRFGSQLAGFSEDNSTTLGNIAGITTGLIANAVTFGGYSSCSAYQCSCPGYYGDRFSNNTCSICGHNYYEHW